MKHIIMLVALCGWLTATCAAETPTIRIGVQVNGTLAWELAVMQAGETIKNAGFKIESQELANAEAGKIALQADSVDMIVSDWIWVSRMRSDGVDFTFYPYSTTSGALMVPEKSAVRTIKELKELKGKRLGIAGGELDKNWLLLQAIANQQQVNLSDSVEKIYGAPPLITEQLKQGRIDAALVYWHYAASLEAHGFRQVIDGKGILRELGISEIVPAIGYVVKKSWAEQNKKALSAFFKAAAEAKTSICTTDAGWAKVLPLLHDNNPTVQKNLRQGYCEGEVKQWGAPQIQAAEKLYDLLRQVSGNALTGKSEHLQPGTFLTLD
jgi:NitT/TauT family transport system substrate-binding protein